MGIAISDVNDDGKPDVPITQANGVKLFLNRGGMKFTDVTAEAGLANLAGDVGGVLRLRPRRPARHLHRQLRRLRPDVAVSGRRRASRDYVPARRLLGVASRLFRNRGGEKLAFEDVSERTGTGEAGRRGSASRSPTSTATAGRTSSSPTTANRIISG